MTTKVIISIPSSHFDTTVRTLDRVFDPASGDPSWEQTSEVKVPKGDTAVIDTYITSTRKLVIEEDIA